MQDTDVSVEEVEEVVDEVAANPAEVVEDADEQAVDGEIVVLERDQALALRHVIERQKAQLCRRRSARNGLGIRLRAEHEPPAGDLLR